MAREAYELAVRLFADTEDAEEGLSDVEEQMDDTSSSLEDEADETQRLSRVWQNAMGVITAALLVAGGVLASQVPVLADLFAGLFAILESVGLQIDSFLRPALSGLVDTLFTWANAIATVEGPLGTLIGLVGTAIIVIAGILGAVFAASAVWGVLAGAVGTVIGVLGGVISIVGTVIGVLAGLISLPALLIAAIIGFAAAWIFNWGNIREKTIALLGMLVPAAISLVEFLVSGLISLGAHMVSGLVGSLLKLRAAWRTGWETLFRVVLSLVKQGANKILGTIENTVNRAIRALNRLPGTNLGTVSIGRFQTEGLGEIAGSARARLSTRLEGAERQQNAFSNRLQQPIVLEIDGRPVAEVVAEIQSGEVRNRGRD